MHFLSNFFPKFLLRDSSLLNYYNLGDLRLSERALGPFQNPLKDGWNKTVSVER